MSEILILHDLHLDIVGFDKLHELKKGYEWLIIGGDLSSYKEWKRNLEFLLREIKPKNTALICGNHEFYNSFLLPMPEIEEYVRMVCKEKGIVYLQKDNAELPNFTIVGNCLWYDYSFVAGENFTTEQLDGGEDDRGYCWNDMYFINLGGKTNAQVTERMNAEFKKQLKLAKSPIIVVTHMCPKKELNAHPMSLFNAYSGNTTAGKILDKLKDNLSLCICGHSHKEVKLGKYINIGNDYGGKLKYWLINL